MLCFWVFFFFKVTATTRIYTSLHTLSLQDALPISWTHAAAAQSRCFRRSAAEQPRRPAGGGSGDRDRTDQRWLRARTDRRQPLARQRRGRPGRDESPYHRGRRHTIAG